MIFGRFGHFQEAAFLLFWAVLAIFRRLHFHCFPAFWPSRSCIFIVVARLGHFQEAAFLLFSAFLAFLRRLHFYYFRPFWPF